MGYWEERRLITKDEIKIGTIIDIWSSHVDPRYNVVIKTHKDVLIYKKLLNTSEGRFYILI